MLEELLGKFADDLICEFKNLLAFVKWFLNMNWDSTGMRINAKKTVLLTNNLFSMWIEI